VSNPTPKEVLQEHLDWFLEDDGARAAKFSVFVLQSCPILVASLPADVADIVAKGMQVGLATLTIEKIKRDSKEEMAREDRTRVYKALLEFRRVLSGVPDVDSMSNLDLREAAGWFDSLRGELAGGYEPPACLSSSVHSNWRDLLDG